MSYAQEQFNPYKHYNVEKYLIAYGLCVDTSYRSRGIATEMLKARAPVLKSLGLKVTTTAFTGIGSQKAAEKAGYEENFVITWVILASIEFVLTKFVILGTTISTHSTQISTSQASPANSLKP